MTPVQAAEIIARVHHAMRWSRDVVAAGDRMQARMVTRMIDPVACRPDATVDCCLSHLEIGRMTDTGLTSVMTCTAARMRNGCVSMENDMAFLGSRGVLWARGRGDILAAVSNEDERHAALNRTLAPIRAKP